MVGLVAGFPCFESLVPYPETWSRGPPSDALVVFVFTLLCPLLFLLVATAAIFNTAFENMLLQRSSFKRASRSLAKTGFFRSLFGVFFPPLFFVRFLRVLGGPFGPQWPSLVPFGSLLGDFWVTFWRLVGSLIFDTPLE